MASTIQISELKPTYRANEWSHRLAQNHPSEVQRAASQGTYLWLARNVGMDPYNSSPYITHYNTLHLSFPFLHSQLAKGKGKGLGPKLDGKDQEQVAMDKPLPGSE